METDQSKIENVALKGLRGQGKTLNVSETLQSFGIETEQNTDEVGFENLVLGLSRLKTTKGNMAHFAEQIDLSLVDKDASILYSELAKIDNPNTLESVCYNIFSSWDAISDDIDVLLTEEEWEIEDFDMELRNDEVEFSKRTLAIYLDDVKMVLDRRSKIANELAKIMDGNDWLANQLKEMPQQLVVELETRLETTALLSPRLLRHISKYDDSNWRICIKDATYLLTFGHPEDEDAMFLNIEELQDWYDEVIRDLRSMAILKGWLLASHKKRLTEYVFSREYIREGLSPTFNGVELVNEKTFSISMENLLTKNSLKEAIDYSHGYFVTKLSVCFGAKTDANILLAKEMAESLIPRVLNHILNEDVIELPLDLKVELEQKFDYKWSAY